MKDDEDPTLKLPPLNNWAEQTFAYGWYLDRTAGDADYSGSYAPGQSGRTGLRSPLPDDIHLLNLNPQSIDMDEPIATEVSVTQEGGKFIESRGGVMKHVSIRGTTGVLPPIAPYATHMRRATIDNALNAPVGVLPLIQEQLSESTGFYEFYRLRRLFRKFMKERRDGKVVFMHYLDFKADEFWVCEPRRFSMSRSKFGYNYSIQFDLIEPSEAPLLPKVEGGGFDSTQRRSRMPLNVIVDTPTRRAITRMGQLFSSGANFVKRFAYGTLAIKMQEIIAKGTALQTFFADTASIIRAAKEVPMTLIKQLNSALTGLQESFFELAPGALRRDVNEWWLELRFLNDGLASYYYQKFGTTPGQELLRENEKYTTQRAQLGTANSLMQEPEDSTGAPSVNPFIGASGFQLTGSITQMAAITSLKAEDIYTGETIWDLAQRLLGDVQRFIDLILLNNLTAPYIVSDKSAKPPGTLAWGDQILVPVSDTSTSLAVGKPAQAPSQSVSGVVTATGTTLIDEAGVDELPWRENQWQGWKVEILTGAAAGDIRVVASNSESELTFNRALSAALSPGDTYRMYLELFSRRRPLTPETRAYGRDILAVFVKSRGVITHGEVDCMLGPHGDLMTVEGLQNLEQAVALILQTPQGSNKMHPLYGVADVLGRPMEVNQLALYLFFARQGLLLDPRIASVEKPQLEFANGALYFTAGIRPVRAQNTSSLRIALS